MKSLSSQSLSKASGGKGPFKIIATAIIRTVEYAFDQWKASRERKHARYKEYCEVVLPAIEASQDSPSLISIAEID